MSTKTRVKQKDKYQCQICRDIQGKKYPSGVEVKIQVHHIIPKSEGGLNTPNNLITVCDFCHDILTKHKWRYQFGDNINPDKMEEVKRNIERYIELREK